MVLFITVEHWNSLICPKEGDNDLIKYGVAY
jgi:hypothetical protein